LKNRSFLDDRSLGNEERVGCPVILEVSKLASDSIWANTVFPESFAFSVLVHLMLARGRNYFVFAMGESAFLSVVAVTEFRECLA